jgi:predicted N-acetyltransferase YhbS
VVSEVINHAREQILKIDAYIRNDFFPIAGSRERFAEAVQSGKKSNTHNHLRGSGTKIGEQRKIATVRFTCVDLH